MPTVERFALQHRTTQHYLTASGTHRSRVTMAEIFDTRGEADTALDALDSFKGAYQVVTVQMAAR